VPKEENQGETRAKLLSDRVLFVITIYNQSSRPLTLSAFLEFASFNPLFCINKQLSLMILALLKSCLKSIKRPIFTLLVRNTPPNTTKHQPLNHQVFLLVKAFSVASSLVVLDLHIHTKGVTILCIWLGIWRLGFEPRHIRQPLTLGCTKFTKKLFLTRIQSVCYDWFR